MENRQWGTLQTLLAVILLVAFVVSLPGFGIETRSFTQYAAWAGPIFLVLTLLVFALGVASIVTVRRRARTSGFFAIGAGFAAIATNLLDFSHIGGPPPPAGPFALGVLTIVVAVGLVLTGSRLSRAPRRPAAASWK